LGAGTDLGPHVVFVLGLDVNDVMSTMHSITGFLDDDIYNVIVVYQEPNQSLC
jgi:hypothetical protein